MRFNPTDFVSLSRDVEPDVQTAGAKNGNGTDCRNFEYCTFAVCAGTLGSSATLDFKVQESSDDGSSDTYSDVSGAAITQMTQAGGDSDTVVKLVVKCSTTERYLRGVMTIGTATSDAGSVAILTNPKAAPVS